MKDILEDITPFKSSIRPNSIFYMNRKGEWIFEQVNSIDGFYVRYIVWEVLEDKYSMKYEDIQELIKY